MSGKKISETEKRLISLMVAMGFEEKDVIGVLLFCETEEVRAALFEYLRFKGKYATVSDALRCAGMIQRARGARHQYLPHHMYVRYIQESTEELSFDHCYQVGTVYGTKEEVYYIMNDRDEKKEYPAAYFVKMRPLVVEYLGAYRKETETMEAECGLVIGEEYRVKKDKGLIYVLEDGTEAFAWDFKVKRLCECEPKELGPLEHETALQLIRGAFEFGDMHGVYDRMTEDTVYESEQLYSTWTGRDAITWHIEEISKNRVLKGVYADVAYATATGDVFEDHYIGERFLMTFENDKTRSAIYVKTDGAFITHILLSNSWPAYQCDEDEINDLGKKQ